MNRRRHMGTTVKSRTEPEAHALRTAEIQLCGGTDPVQSRVPKRRREGGSSEHHARSPFGSSPVAARLRKVVAPLHPHLVIGSAPADILQCQRHVRGYSCLAV